MPAEVVLPQVLTAVENGVARRFIDLNPRGRVLVVTGQTSDFVCPTWLNPNLQALISKDDAFDSLRCELDDLTGSETRPASSQNTSTQALTEREAEVFGLIGDGLTTREIAERLGLSEHMVQTHRKRIATRLCTSGASVTSAGSNEGSGCAGARGELK
ncbi:MAG: LuxR C-terminal-related transcriptional regulator [Planctomycetia bacterium]|nr:LuxR C-terminal-related transcriptional regulator [Planctomycetia bacterium]